MDMPLLNCFNKDAQADLLVALKRKDINGFRQIVDTHKVDLEEIGDEDYLSIFNIACQSTDYHEFVEECLEYGCDVNRLNTHFEKTAINFAVESLDVRNISLIVNQLTTNLDHKYANQTSLNFLASNLTNVNYSDLFQCIRLLIEHQANPNIPNQRQITPIVTILKNKEIDYDQKEEIVKYLLDNAQDIDLDNYRNGEARKLLTQLYPHFNLPPIAEKLKWDFTTLMRTLNSEREAVFLRGLSEIYQELQNDSYALEKLFCEHEADETLLITATRMSYAVAVERMIRLGANVNYKIKKNLSAIEVACRYGRYKVLELLLKTPKIELRTAEPLLTIVVKRVGEETSKICDYDTCFDLLIHHLGTDMDRTDLFGSSALHYAVTYSNQRIVSQLLQKGAYMGVTNKFDHLAIYDINAKVLETHLNSCISTNNARNGDESFEIVFDYMNLVPDCYKPKNGQLGRKIPSFKHELNEFKNEMTPINYIANCKDLKHLLTHPLITSFLFLKWQRLAFIFYINFILYTIFCLTMLSYILFCYREEMDLGPFQPVLYTISLILAISLLLREILQFVMSPNIYLKTLGNYLEIALIMTVFYILLCNKNNDEPTTQRSVAAFAILFIIAEFFLLTGSLPYMSLSTHLVMLKTVSKTFIRSLFLYSIILVAFSLCFYTLFNEGTSGETKEDDGDDFNKFSNPGASGLKTLVMLTGEFEAANINFKLNPSSYVIFLMFLFLISTVLFNLLSGLAVSDTQAIISQAELTGIMHRAEMMGRYEGIVLVQSDNYLKSHIKSWASSYISLFKGHLAQNKAFVLPNVKNQIIRCSPYDAKKSLHSAYDAEADNRNTLFEVSRDWLLFRKHRTSMHSSIVKNTLKLIQQKINDRIEEDKENELIERIRNIEEKLTEVLHKLHIIADANVENRA